MLKPAAIYTGALAAGVVLSGMVRAETPSFEVTTKKAEDKVEAKVEKDAAVFDVFSPSGIGGAEIVLAKGNWPTAVIVRLHLRGLESFTASNSKIKLAGSVSSGNGKPNRMYFVEDGTERDAGTEIKVFDAPGKPAAGLPGKDGYLEIGLPRELLQNQRKRLSLGWIDFYRG